MKLSSIRIFGSLAAILLMGISARAAAPDLPSMQDILSDFSNKQYQDVIRKVSQVLPLSSDASKGYDKGNLLAIKGESHLQLKQFSLASDAFMGASKVMSDPNDAGLMKAMAILIRRSGNGIYQPRQPTTRPVDAAGGKPAPINIIEIEGRKEALLALFNDEAKVASIKLEPLKKVPSLPPLMDGIKQIGDLRTIEMAATGKDDTTKAMIAGLAAHATELMSGAIKSMSDNVDKLQQLANQTSTDTETNSNGTAFVITTKRGLNSNEKNALNDIINTNTSILAACDQFTDAAKTDASAFASVKSAATSLSKHADEVLHADYNSTLSNQPPITTQNPHRNGGMGMGR
jgi:hypothetical protein